MNPLSSMRCRQAPAACRRALARAWQTAWPALAALTTAIAGSATLLLGGCASPAGIAPEVQALAPASVGVPVHGPAQPALDAAWWRGWDDPALGQLIERALAGNPSLQVAQARVARADAALAGARSLDGPHVDGSVDLTRQRFTANGIYPPPLGGSIQTLGTAQLDASWEFDFFGRNRAAIDAALGGRRAAEADLQAARSVLATSLARDYVQLGRLFAQRDVAQRALLQREETLALVRQRVQGGLDTRLELRQGEGALPEARLQIEQIDEQIALQRNALAALSGQAPEATSRLVVALDRLRPQPLPTVLPADLLGRRADIAAARWRVEAATGEVAGARAQFYPDINLSAFAGFSSIGLDQLLRSGSRQYGVGPALRLPIFDAGRLRANLRGRTADLDAAVASYNASVIDAVHEASDDLASLRSIALQQAQQVQAQEAAESAWDLATQRYRAGLSTYLSVLSAESSVLAQRRLAVDLHARALDAQVALIRSLGGGYAADSPALASNTGVRP